MTGSAATAKVEALTPSVETVSVEDAFARLPRSGLQAPFSDDVVSFCAEFSRRLGRRARNLPELAALAYWMRKAELIRLKSAFESLASSRTLLVPRGVVFHVPPANVDTIFVYSWLLSVLVGNQNVVRMSSRSSEATDLILDVLRDLLADDDYSFMHSNTVFLRYGHDQDVTSEISARSDVRVIWGGDRTIATIRRSPLPPHATELTFPDRFSMAALRTKSYAAIDDDSRDLLAERFFNDAYWFDQMGCSSPRLVLWVGDKEASKIAADDFYARLARVLQGRTHTVDTAMAIGKMTFGYRSALDFPVESVNWISNELVVLPLADLAAVGGDFFGAGTFFQANVDALTDLAEHLERRHQTLSHFGFTQDELRGFVKLVNGRGLDRIVPFGQALTFNRFWDGHDLLQALTRRVYLDAGGESDD